MQAGLVVQLFGKAVVELEVAAIHAAQHQIIDIFGGNARGHGGHGFIEQMVAAAGYGDFAQSVVAKGKHGLEAEQVAKHGTDAHQAAAVGELLKRMHAEHHFAARFELLQMRHGLRRGAAAFEQAQGFECEKAFRHAGHAGVEHMNGELAGHLVGHLADNLMALAHAPADGGDDGFVIALCFQIAEGFAQSQRRSDTRIRQKYLIFLLFPIIAAILNLSDSRIRPTYHSNQK